MIAEALFYLLLVLLPVQLGYHFWPQWAMVLGRRVDYLSPTLYLTDLIIIALVVAARQFPRRKHIAVFLFFAFLSCVIAADRWVAAYVWGKIAEYSLLALYIVRTKPARAKTILYISFGVVWSSVLALIQFFLQRSAGFWILGERSFTAATPGIALFDTGRTWLRAYATFPHPNVLGGYLAVGIALFISQRAKKKIWYGVTIFLACIALAITFSRSAMTVLFPPLLLFFGTGLQPGDEAVAVRLQLNDAAVSMFRQHALFGVGIGNFLVRLPQYLVSRQIYFLQPVHNMYLLILSETGLAGTVLLLSCIYLYVRHMKRFTVFHYCLLMLLAVGLVDHYPLTLQQGQLLLTLLLALSWVYGRGAHA